MNKKKWRIKSVLTAFVAISAFSLAIPAEAATNSKAVAKKMAVIKKSTNSQSTLTIKSEIDAAAKALKDKKVESAAEHLAKVDSLVKRAEKSGLSKTSKLMKDATVKWASTLTEFNKKGTLYIASSTNASKPTTFGPAKGSQTIKNTIFIFAGKNEQIKLKNLTVNANIFVKGSSTGAGTVSLENVKVNKVNGFGGSIVVAEHSVHLKAVQAEGVIINDPNDSNLVAEGGVKVKNFTVTETAGVTGMVTLESKGSSSFGSMTLASKGKSGVVLKGDFGSSKVTVIGKNSQIRAAKGAVINAMEIKSDAKIYAEGGATIRTISLSAEKIGTKIELAGTLKETVATITNNNASISVAAGTNIAEIKKGSSVTGTIVIDNHGTIARADGGMTVKGNQPVVITEANPTPTPTPVIIKPVLKSIEAKFTTGSSVMDDHGTISLTGVTNDRLFQGVVITTDQPSSVTLKITSLTAMGSDSNWLTSPREFIISKDTPITISDLVGNSGTGSTGVKMETLRSFFMDKPITLKGTLIYTGPNGGESDPIVINIYL